MTGEDGLRLVPHAWPRSNARGRVLLVHGFGDHAGRYGDLARVLNARGYALHAWDQRGHGDSPGRRGHVERFELFLADLDRAWATLVGSGPGPHVLYGHSFGGLVAMRWLQTRPDRPSGVVLSAPWLATALHVPAWKRAAARALLRLAPGLPISSGSGDPERLTRDPGRRAAYLADPRVHHRITARFHEETGRAQAASRSAGLPPEVPALLVVPGDDRLVDAGAALAWARAHGHGVAVRVRAGGRHELHNDVDREEALGAIADWLDSLPAPNP